MHFVPIVASLLIVAFAGYFVHTKKTQKHIAPIVAQPNIANFTRQKNCGRPPQFLKRLKIPQPVMIDLSQKRFKGIALLHGKNFSKTLHPKIWEQYEHFSTYSLDEQGNIYLVPTPFISVRPTTFNLQKNIYKLDSKTGKIEIFMNFDDVHPSPYNPYGINAIAYDCDDKTLWVAAIDESDYYTQRGVIYHIDPKTKKIFQKIEGIDVLSMRIVKSKQSKYLLVGSASDNALYAYEFIKGKLNQKPQKLLELPNPNEHIRKIKVKSNNHLELQSIPFSYTLIAQTAKKDRIHYDAKWNSSLMKWNIVQR